MALGLVGRDAAPAPPREAVAPIDVGAAGIGVRSRAAYEAERLMQWATGRPSVTPVKASNISPVPEPVVRPPPPGSPRAVDVKGGGGAAAGGPRSSRRRTMRKPLRRQRRRASGRAGDGRAEPTRAWSVPVLRGCVSAGAGPAAAPRVVPWDRARGGAASALRARGGIGGGRRGGFIGGRSRATTSGWPPTARRCSASPVPWPRWRRRRGGLRPTAGHLNPPGATLPAPTPRVRLRCLLGRRRRRRRCGQRRCGAARRGPGGELECRFEAPPSPAVQVADEGDDVVDVGVLSPLPAGAGRSPSSRRICCRTTCAWGAVPRFGRVVAARGLARGLRRADLVLVVAARMRADYLGVLVVLATMAPGAILSVSGARGVNGARDVGAAKKCKDAEASCSEARHARTRTARPAGAGRRSDQFCAARAVAVADAHAGDSGAAARREAAGRTRSSTLRR